MNKGKETVWRYHFWWWGNLLSRPIVTISLLPSLLPNIAVSSGSSSLAEIITRGIKKSNELLLPFLSSLGIQVTCLLFSFQSYCHWCHFHLKLNPSFDPFLFYFPPLQSLARQLALSSDSTKPHHIFEGISRSDVINCQHSMLGLMATSFAQKAALWRMYGKPQMALLATQALLQLNSIKYGVPQFGSPEVLALVIWIVICRALSFCNRNMQMRLLTDMFHIFVHDRIYNSVADYRSSRVGVGCRMSYVGGPLFSFFSWWDNFWTLWARGLKICVGPYYGNLLQE